jgi:hypothetical protein
MCALLCSSVLLDLITVEYKKVKFGTHICRIIDHVWLFFFNFGQVAFEIQAIKKSPTPS